MKKMKLIQLWNKYSQKIIGSLKCSQGGHNLTNKLLRKLFSDQKNYSLIYVGIIIDYYFSFVKMVNYIEFVL